MIAELILYALAMLLLVLLVAQELRFKRTMNDYERTCGKLQMELHHIRMDDPDDLRIVEDVFHSAPYYDAIGRPYDISGSELADIYPDAYEVWMEYIDPAQSDYAPGTMSGDEFYKLAMEDKLRLIRGIK